MSEANKWGDDYPYYFLALAKVQKHHTPLGPTGNGASTG